ncbi:MAG: histone acetyltransferase 1 [Bogoriella megaspora]|nr:MAG: histone acetyltransferase 1 [Bogoriella megaspora]
MAVETPASDLDNHDKLAEIGADWSYDSNEATTLKFWRVSEQGGQLQCDHSFHPSYTYPIFGEEETIFGYQGLHIDINFALHDLRCNVDIRFKNIFEPVGDIEAFDIPTALRPFVPSSALETDHKEFAASLDSDSTAGTFVPPGKIIHSYTVDGEEYEIWCSTLRDPRARDIVANAQVLMPFFIEGATTLELDGTERNVLERWKLYLLYKVLPFAKPEDNETSIKETASRYSIAGYSTSFRLWYLSENRTKPKLFTPDYKFPDNNLEDSISSSLPTPETSPYHPTSEATNPDDPLFNEMHEIDYPVRERISQFLILPPFRGSSHGFHLYTAMISLFLRDPTCTTITVEDPNEAFDDLRDTSDLARLRNNAANLSLVSSPSLTSSFLSLKIDPNRARKIVSSFPQKHRDRVPIPAIIDKPLRDRVHAESKIQHRQFDRCLEMHLLSSIPVAHRSKNRIAYKHNSPQAADKEYYFWRCLVKERLRVHNKDSLADLEEDEREEKLEEAVTNVQQDFERLLEAVKRREERAKEVGVGVGDEVEAGSGEGERKRKLRRVVDDEDEDGDGDEGVPVGANGEQVGKDVKEPEAKKVKLS